MRAAPALDANTQLNELMWRRENYCHVDWVATVVPRDYRVLRTLVLDGKAHFDPARRISLLSQLNKTGAAIFDSFMQEDAVAMGNLPARDLLARPANDSDARVFVLPLVSTDKPPVVMGYQWWLLAQKAMQRTACERFEIGQDTEAKARINARNKDLIKEHKQRLKLAARERKRAAAEAAREAAAAAAAAAAEEVAIDPETLLPMPPEDRGHAPEVEAEGIARGRARRARPPRLVDSGSEGENGGGDGDDDDEGETAEEAASAVLDAKWNDPRTWREHVLRVATLEKQRVQYEWGVLSQAKERLIYDGVGKKHWRPQYEYLIKRAESAALRDFCLNFFLDDSVHELARVEERQFQLLARTAGGSLMEPEPRRVLLEEDAFSVLDAITYYIITNPKIAAVHGQVGQYYPDLNINEQMYCLIANLCPMLHPRVCVQPMHCTSESIHDTHRVSL